MRTHNVTLIRFSNGIGGLLDIRRRCADPRDSGRPGWDQALSTGISRNAPTSSQPFFAARSTHARTRSRCCRHSIRLSRRWRRGSNAMWTSSLQAAGSRQLCILVTEPTAPCLPISTRASDQRSKACLMLRFRLERSVRARSRTIFSERSRVCANLPTISGPTMRTI